MRTGGFGPRFPLWKSSRSSSRLRSRMTAIAHDGYRVVEYAVGDDCPDDAAEIAEREGWAGKAHESAPENKDAAPKRRTKSK